MKTLIKHCRDCGPACCIKTYAVRFADGGTEDQRERAFDHTQHSFMQCARSAAHGCGYEDVTTCGRSDGWLVPYFLSAGTGRVMFPDLDDPEELKIFEDFAERIDVLMQNVPIDYVENLAIIIRYDADEGE